MATVDDLPDATLNAAINKFLAELETARAAMAIRGVNTRELDAKIEFLTRDDPQTRALIKFKVVEAYNRKTAKK